MQAYVYKSRRKSDTYVYLRESEGFGLIPEPLRDSLGKLDFVLEVALTPGRKLAREDAAVVRSHLAAHGFHLQLPPTDSNASGALGIDRLADMSALAPQSPSHATGDAIGSQHRAMSFQLDEPHGDA